MRCSPILCIPLILISVSATLAQERATLDTKWTDEGDRSRDLCEISETASLTGVGGMLSYFGADVSVSGDAAVVLSASGHNGRKPRVYRLDGVDWVMEAELTTSDGFVAGSSIALAGDLVVLGDRMNDDAGTNAGAAYVFRFDGLQWNQEAKLTAPDAAPYDYFGEAVSVNDNAIVIGAPEDDDSGPDCGSAYVFRFDGQQWNYEAELTPDGTFDSIEFGASVSVNGDLIAIGAPQHEGNGERTGAACVFRFNGLEWDLETWLSVSSPDDYSLLGFSISSGTDTIVVGVLYGSAYVFRYDGLNWVEEAALNDAITPVNARQVAIDDDMAIVGGTGRAYVFEFDSVDWIETARLVRPLPPYSDGFVASVGVDGGVVMLGAPGIMYDPPSTTGTVYIYHLFDCQPNGAYDQCDIAAGTSADCNGNGVPDECDIAACAGETWCEDCNGNGVPDGCESPHPNVPVASADPAAVCVGAPATLSASAGGAEIDWYVDSCGGSFIHTGDTFQVTPNETTTYYARARDPVTGCVSTDCAAVTVTVNTTMGPTITEQPTDQDFCAGGSMTLQVTATGTGTMTYQWYKGTVVLVDDDRISGTTTDTLTINPTAATDQGDYSVGVTDDCGTTTSETAVAVEVSLQVAGYATDSPTQDLTTGGATVTFAGQLLTSGMSVVFVTPDYQVAVPPDDVVANGDGTELIVEVPAVPPGCDCSSETPLVADVTFENACGTAALSDSGANFTYAIATVPVGDPAGVQPAIDNSPPGSCIVLEAYVNFVGPLAIDSTHTKITLTSSEPDTYGATQINGLYSGGGQPPQDATITFDGCGSDICVSGLDFILGNSGAEIIEGATPLIKHCTFSNNFADAVHGGGMTILTGARPKIFGGSQIAGNTALGSGGGVRIDGASAEIVDSFVSANIAATPGAGFYLRNTTADLVIADSEISENHFGLDTPRAGGGVYWTGGTLEVPAEGTLRGNVIRNNLAASGAGIFVDQFVWPLIVRNVIGSNEGLTTASKGGGIYVQEFNRNLFWVCENVIHGNEAQIGGALALMKKSEVRVIRNLIFCNRAVQQAPSGTPPFYAAGIYVNDAQPLVDHNTIYRNTGAGMDDQSGGIHNEVNAGAYPTFSNNILFRNEDFEIFAESSMPPQQFDWNLAYDPDEPDRIYSLSITPGVDNIYVDPLFVDPNCLTADPYYAFALQATSPALCTADDDCSRGALYSDVCENCEPEPCQCDCVGDVNCDGQVDFGDINAFVDYVANHAQWQEDFPDCDPRNGDIDYDGVYPSFGDLNPFVNLLTTNPLPIVCEPCP